MPLHKLVFYLLLNYTMWNVCLFLKHLCWINVLSVFSVFLLVQNLKLTFSKDFLNLVLWEIVIYNNVNYPLWIIWEPKIKSKYLHVTFMTKEILENKENLTFWKIHVNPRAQTHYTDTTTYQITLSAVLWRGEFFRTKRIVSVLANFKNI